MKEAGRKVDFGRRFSCKLLGCPKLRLTPGSPSNGHNEHLAPPALLKIFLNNFSSLRATIPYLSNAGKYVHHGLPLHFCKPSNPNISPPPQDILVGLNAPFEAQRGGNLIGSKPHGNVEQGGRCCLSLQSYLPTCTYVYACMCAYE